MNNSGAFVRRDLNLQPYKRAASSLPLSYLAVKNMLTVSFQLLKIFTHLQTLPSLPFILVYFKTLIELCEHQLKLQINFIHCIHVKNENEV